MTHCSAVEQLNMPVARGRGSLEERETIAILVILFLLHEKIVFGVSISKV
jgi:hypothetical protein